MHYLLAFSEIIHQIISSRGVVSWKVPGLHYILDKTYVLRTGSKPQTSDPRTHQGFMICSAESWSIAHR
jgi:hypothetical protein